jgi:hypothetical protein
MVAIWKRNKNEININFCVPNCDHWSVNWLNFWSQLGHSRCITLDFILRILLSLNEWLNSCVSIERMISVIKGVRFGKRKSRKMSKWIIVSVLITRGKVQAPSTLAPQHLFSTYSTYSTYSAPRATLNMSTYSTYSTCSVYYNSLQSNLISECIQDKCST